MRLRDGLWSLRGPRLQSAVLEAIRRYGRQRDFAIVHYSVQSAHVHLAVEAAEPGALARGMRRLNTCIAMRINKAMRRQGAVVADRYYARRLRSLGEADNVLRYILWNREHHTGEDVPDRFASVERPLAAPRTWLLRNASHGWEDQVISREVS